jgi:hypothetical protein
MYVDQYYARHFETWCDSPDDFITQASQSINSNLISWQYNLYDLITNCRHSSRFFIHLSLIKSISHHGQDTFQAICCCCQSTSEESRRWRKKEEEAHGVLLELHLQGLEAGESSVL